MKKLEDRRYKVYCYTCKDNGKKYVGITCNTLSTRAGGRGNGYKECTCFWRGIQKHGWDNFSVEILAEDLMEEEACKLEIHYISEYKSNDPHFGYNITKGGNVGYCTHATEETKAKLSKALRDKPRPRKPKELTEEDLKRIKEEAKNSVSLASNAKSVLCIELNIEFASAAKAGEIMGINYKDICAVCAGKAFSAGGYSWKYIDKKFKSKPAFSKPIYCVELDKEFDSMNEASREIGISTDSIKRVLMEEQESTKGLHFKYVNESDFKPYEKTGKIGIGAKPVRCIELNKEFRTLDEVAEYFGKSNARHVKKACMKYHYTAYGYHWTYVNPELVPEDYWEEVEKKPSSVCKAVRCIETNEVFISATEAGKQLNISSSQVNSCARGEIKSAFGYHFEYINEEDRNKAIKKRNKINSAPYYACKKVLYCPELNKTWNKTADAEKELGLYDGKISLIINGHVPPVEGLTFEYKESPIKIYCEETGKKYSSFRDAAEDTGSKIPAIRRVCSGERKSCHGYHFHYVQDQP